ncbi:beta-lactamase family protein [Amycolatopsis sp. H6(2020)]|nr:beta-lactamase family protein [Amycolatopsis sp. H6(2020)]
MSMHTTRRAVFGLFGAAAGLLATGVPGDATTSGVVSRDLMPGGRFDRFVAGRVAADQFSGAVLVAHRGKPVLTRFHGLARPGVPNASGTRFDLASITKCLTAVAVAQLAQQGAVAFHQPLGAYLDGFPADVSRATVHQLLTHTAGVGRPGLTNQRPADEDTWGSVDDVWQGMSAYLRTLPLRFTPGSQFGYSNDGYFVLGAIVAAASGLSFHDYIRQHVFAQAGMTSAAFSTKPQIRGDDSIALGYATQPGGPRVDATTLPGFPYVGGPFTGAYCTTQDLLRFAIALHGGRLLNPAFTNLATAGKQAVSPVDLPQGQFYGYGQVEAITGAHRIVGHTGGGPGRSNNLDVFPDTGWIAVVLGNYDTSVRPIVDLARQLIVS